LWPRFLGVDMIDKFIDAWFTGRFLKHPVITLIVGFVLGVLLSK
jgi:hypothetical protein